MGIVMKHCHLLSLCTCTPHLCIWYILDCIDTTVDLQSKEAVLRLSMYTALRRMGPLRFVFWNDIVQANGGIFAR